MHTTKRHILGKLQQFIWHAICLKRNPMARTGHRGKGIKESAFVGQTWESPGRYVTPGGYVRIKIKGHHLANKNGWVFEHRIVAEQILGRRLSPGEVVHHINGNRCDNRRENLEVYMDQGHHRVAHQKCGVDYGGKDHFAVECACGCGSKIVIMNLYGELKLFVSDHHLRLEDPKRTCNSLINDKGEKNVIPE